MIVTRVCLHLLSYWPLFFGAIIWSSSLSLNAQALDKPDSLSQTVDLLVNFLSNEDTSVPNDIAYPTSLEDFFTYLPKAVNTEEELYYLAYSYEGYLQSLKSKYHDALTFYETGNRYLAATKPYHILRGHYYMHRAKALLYTGEIERGMQSFKAAKEVFTHHKDIPSLNQVYLNEAEYYIQNNDLKKALQILEKSVQKTKRIKNPQINTFIKRGHLFSLGNEFEKADADFAAAKKLLSPTDSKLQGTLESFIGQHLLRQNKPEEAQQLYDDALEKLCPDIREKKSAAFENCLHPRAFLNTLSFRGHTLSLIYEKNAQPATLKKMYNNYITGIRYLHFLAKNDKAFFPSEERHQLLNTFLDKGMNICFLLDSIYSATSIYFQHALHLSGTAKGLSKKPSVQLTDLQRLAAQEESSFLSFYDGKQEVYALVIYKNGRQFQKIKKGKDFDKDLNLLIRLHHQSFKSIKDINDFKDLSQQLYQHLFKDLELPGKKLCIIPDGAFRFLPFESFITSSEPTADYPVSYLLFEKDIRYAASIAQLTRDVGKSPLDTRSVVNFVPMDFKQHGLIPLKGTNSHVRFLEIKFNCKKWINADANVDNFETAINEKEHNIVVFTTHADAGATPSIYFHDKKLPVSEISTLPMKANMAVLNNCNTPVTNKENSTGVIGISNAFSESGIPTTIAPLWQVQQQMNIKVLEMFYLNIASGMAKDEAMTQAKVNYLKSCGNDAIACSPHFWAANILTGNTAAVYEKSYFLPVVILLLLILLIIVYRRSQQQIA